MAHGQHRSFSRQHKTVFPQLLYFLDWLRFAVDGKSPRTQEHYEYIARRLWEFLASSGYPQEVSQLGPHHFRAFYAAARDEGVKPNTLASFDRTLRAVFRRSQREGLEDFDLPRGWKSPRGRLAVVGHRT